MLNDCLSPDQWVALFGLAILLFGAGIKLGYKWGKNDGFAKGYIRGMRIGKLGRTDA